MLGNNNYKKLDNKFTIQGNRKLRSEEIKKKQQLRNTWYSNCKCLWQKLELNILTFIFRQEDKNNWLNANKVLGFRIARSEVPDDCKILTSVDK